MIDTDIFKSFLDKEQRLINEYGYVVQFVADGENSFVYTIGRNDLGKPDFYVANCHPAYIYLINEIVERSESVRLDWVYESNHSFWIHDPTRRIKTKFRLRSIDIDSVKDKVTGLYNRYNQPDYIQLIQIHIADENYDV